MAHALVVPAQAPEEAERFDAEVGGGRRAGRGRLRGTRRRRRSGRVESAGGAARRAAGLARLRPARPPPRQRTPLHRGDLPPQPPIAHPHRRPKCYNQGRRVSYE